MTGMMVRNVSIAVRKWGISALMVPVILSTQVLVQTSAQTIGDRYPSDLYWIGKGQGDLTKGGAVCRRVAELSARADLAKQIRVLVKERLVDRVRERSGKEPEQDIELTREEIVQEYLLGVTIVDYRIDEEQKTCSVTAVMVKE
ncbi:MAG: hypothetical protein NNA31_00365 [Nitrospira sp.]|nr:hypothetical protein [Nitrospira sp.]